VLKIMRQPDRSHSAPPDLTLAQVAVPEAVG